MCQSLKVLDFVLILPEPFLEHAAHDFIDLIIETGETKHFLLKIR